MTKVGEGGSPTPTGMIDVPCRLSQCCFSDSSSCGVCAGRIIDHVRNSQGFGLEDLAVLVLDEADRLLEMGFKEELRELLRLAPRNRQTMLFSATFNDDVQQLACE